MLTSSTAAMAASCSAAVEDVLDGEVDVDAFSLAGNLDAITEGADGAVGPAATAVYRQDEHTISSPASASTHTEECVGSMTWSACWCR